jgi:hypothetical protein
MGKQSITESATNTRGFRAFKVESEIVLWAPKSSEREPVWLC